jgi:transcriptional regulator GlxA family with amidase domain
MMLKLIEMKADKSLALEVASVFIYDQTHASTDSQPSLSLGQLEMREPRLATAVRLMEDNIDTPLPVSAIAKRTDLSAKMLEILFRKHLDTSPGEHYSRLRLMMARKLVLDTTLTIHEISIRAGFSSQSAFSRSFRRAFETSPSRLRLDRN